MRLFFKLKNTPVKTGSQPPSRLEGAMLFMGSLIALVVGWFSLISGVEHLVLYMQSRAWITVPATVEMVDVMQTGRHGSRRVTATYRYVYESREYVGTRVGLSRGGDNFGSWSDETYARIAAARGSGKTLDCYVDPDRPERAVLDRALRPGVLFLELGAGLPFALFGTLMWAAYTWTVISKIWRGSKGECP